MACICNPQTEEDRQNLEHYGCPEEICPGCYADKRHDDPYCQACMNFLENVEEQLTESYEPVTVIPMEKTLYLMQGVPGSGKSTIAKMIAFHERENGKRVAHLSTDVWRFDNDGTYVFDPADNQRYHKACQQAAAERMAEGIECVIIDNTNIQEWQAHPYIILANIFEYTIQTISVDAGLHHAIKRQVLRREDRRVPDHVIKQMYFNMERLLATPPFMPPEEDDEDD